MPARFFSRAVVVKRMVAHTITHEFVLQTLVFSRFLCSWADHPEKRWLNWSLGTIFVVACLLPVLGLRAIRAGSQSRWRAGCRPMSQQFATR